MWATGMKGHIEGADSGRMERSALETPTGLHPSDLESSAAAESARHDA